MTAPETGAGVRIQTPAPIVSMPGPGALPGTEARPPLRAAANRQGLGGNECPPMRCDQTMGNIPYIVKRFPTLISHEVMEAHQVWPSRA